MPIPERLAKIIVLGDSSVGKTSLLMRYTDDAFSGEFLTTLGFDYRRKEVIIDGNPLMLQLWDTAGQEQFRSITKSYMRGANGIALIFDVTSHDSFTRINAWMESIADVVVKQIKIVLIGNKIDSPARTVTLEKASALADEFAVPYYEVSAKTGEGVATAFDALAQQVAEHLEKPVQQVSPPQESKCC
jgi:Ras-related protein Rab-8A